MTRRLLAVCLSIVLPATVGAVDAPTVYAQRQAAVVALTCVDLGGGLGYYGTGAVVSADGLILTNVTVVPAGAQRIRVTFSDGRILPGELIASDLRSEASLLRVPARDLVHMPLADSAAVRVCDPVLTWGNPHQTLEQDGVVSFSQGCISGRYDIASVDAQSRYWGPVLETDAAINPGSDGGPLTDADGRLIGIMSLAFARSRWLGTAIPIARMRAGIPALVARPIGQRDEQHLRAWPIHRQAGRCLAAVAPALVAIRLPDGSADPPLRRVAHSGPGPAVPGLLQGEVERQVWRDGCTTGFICDPDGWVLCAATALGSERGELDRLWLYDHLGQRHGARLIGFDARADVALLRIDGDRQDWPHLPLAGGEALDSGTTVLLPGMSEWPGGPTCTIGRISAIRRNHDMAYQVSCLMNWGNIGGPVLDLEGRVVGLACWLDDDSPWRQNCGVAFVLRAEHLAGGLAAMQGGADLALPERPFLGISTRHLAGGGIPVDAIVPGSAAAAAGLLVGDRIVAIDGHQTANWQRFAELIDGHRPGDRLQVTVQRGAERLELSVVLGSRPGVR